MRRQRIRLTEGDLRRIVNRSVRRALREWADGTDTTYAYHVATLGEYDSQEEEADEAYRIYDMLTHNEIDADEAIEMITNGDLTADSEPEAVGRGCLNFGESNDGRYFLTYDQYTGALDVWEKCG